MTLEHDQLANILAQRRQRSADIVAVDAPTIKSVIFTVGGVQCAFPGQQIVEILPLTTIHFVPGCPTCVEGVINVRGEIASVLRLGDVLALTHAPDTRQSAILLGQSLATDPVIRSGLRVDQVLDVLDVIAASIQPPPDTLQEPLRTLATGVFLHQGRTVVALDLERLLLDLQGHDA